MKICQFFLTILCGNEISKQIKDHNSGTNMRKILCNNHKLDLAKMNADIKFGEILPVGSPDIELKQKKIAQIKDHNSVTNVQ